MQSSYVPYGARNPRGHSAAEVLAALAGQAEYTTYDPLAEEEGMTLVIPDQGEVMLLEAVTGVDHYLRLYVNDVTVGLTTAQVEALTETAFTEASFTGYAARTLTGGAWTITPGAPAAAVYGSQVFRSSASQPAQTLRGYYVTRASDGKLAWFERFTDPVDIAGADEFIRVVARFTLQDTGD